MNSYGFVGHRNGTSWTRRAIARIGKLRTALLALAFVVTAFSGTAMAHPIPHVGPPWEFTFSGILIDACGPASAVSVGLSDFGSGYIQLEVVDTGGDTLTAGLLAGNSGRAVYESPNSLSDICPFDQNGGYDVRVTLDCASRFPTLDIVLLNTPFGPIEFHSQSGACNWIPPLHWGDELRPINFKVAYPEKVYVTDPFPFAVGAFIFNNLPIPIALSVEVVPENNDICSVVSYGSSFGGTSVRSHEYLLGANNSLGLPGVDGDEFIFGDSVIISADVRALAVGHCRLVMLAVIKTAGDLKPVTLDSRVVDILLTAPPPFADLGSMTIHGGSCDFSFIEENAPPGAIQPIQVSAGRVTVDATMEFVETCPDFNDHGSLRIEKWDSGIQDWIDVENGAVDLSHRGEERAHGVINLPKGLHTFRVTGVYYEGWFDWGCLLSIGIAVEGVGVLIAALLDPEPITRAALTVIAIKLIFAAIGAGVFCTSLGSTIFADYEVEVEAREATPVDDLQRTAVDTIDLLGVLIDSNDYDAGHL